MLTMVIPNRNPGEIRMACQQVKICPVRGISFSIIIEGEDCAVWERNTADTLPVATAKSIQ